MAVETLQDLIDLIESGPSDVREALELIKKQAPGLPEKTALALLDSFVVQDNSAGAAQRMSYETLRDVLDGRFSHPSKQTKASAATMDLSDVPHGGTVQITGDEIIESFGAGIDGKQVVIVLDDEATVENNANINTSTGEDYEARPAVINERIRMMYDDGQWHFISLPPHVRIENANGVAVRRPDGTQYCRNDNIGSEAVTEESGNWWRSPNDLSWTFPASFSDRPIAHAGIGGSGGIDRNRVVGAYQQQSTTDAIFRIFTASGSSSTESRVGADANGEWK